MSSKDLLKVKQEQPGSMCVDATTLESKKKPLFPSQAKMGTFNEGNSRKSTPAGAKQIRGAKGVTHRRGDVHRVIYGRECSTAQE